MFGSHALGLVLVLAMCFATWDTDASGVAAFKLSGDENDNAQRTPRQLRVKTNDLTSDLALQAPASLDTKKSEHRQLFLITSIISNLFGLDDKESHSSDSSSSAASSTPIPTRAPVTPSPAPKPSPMPNATLVPTAKPSRDPLDKISW